MTLAGAKLMLKRAQGVALVGLMDSATVVRWLAQPITPVLRENCLSQNENLTCYSRSTAITAAELSRNYSRSLKN